MATATWKFALTDLPTVGTAQVTKAFLEKPQDTKYTRRRNGYCELACVVADPGDLADLEGAVYRRAIKAYRNGVLRFNGQIVEHEETSEGFTVVAKDPYYNMSWRRVRKNKTFPVADAAARAAELITDQNMLHPSFLRIGALDTSTSLVEKDLTEGLVVAEQIDTICKYTGSFLFRIDAVDNVNGTMADFLAIRPFDTVAAKARFEYGQDTLNTVAEYGRKSLPLVNKANVVGTRNTSDLVGSYESLVSVPIHGLWEDERGHVTNIKLDDLKAIARFLVMDKVRYAVSVRPTAESPQLFTDFDVHQKVPVVLKRRGKTISGNLPVIRCTVALDPDSGAEMVEELVLLYEEDA